MKCPYCDVDLVLGQAIRTDALMARGCWHTYVHTIDTLSFQFCGKCPKCGFSDDDITSWHDEIVAIIGLEKFTTEYGQQFNENT